MLGTVWSGQNLRGGRYVSSPEQAGLAKKYEKAIEQAKDSNPDSTFPPLVSAPV